MTGTGISDAWDEWRARIDLNEFHVRFQRMEESGEASHGEADFIESLQPTSVLDAGCGMGRVAIELNRRGIEVDGADLDDDLLAFARADAPHIRWHLADLATMSLGRSFHVVAMPGNVMIFCRSEARANIVANLASHLIDGGLLVAGFSLETGGGGLLVAGRPLEMPACEVTLSEYDAACTAAGLILADRFATWDRAPYAGGDYAVSVHRKSR